MIIDGHAHSRGYFYNVDKLISILDELNVDKVVLCPGPKNDNKNLSLPNISNIIKRRDLMSFMNRIIRFVTSLSHTSNNIVTRNELVYSFHQKHPDRIIQFYWVDPNMVDVIKILEKKYNEWNFRGIKLHQCIEIFRNDSPSLQNLVNFAREKSLPIFIHLSSKIEVKRFIKLALKNPNTTFIVAHLIGLEIFKKLTQGINNVYFEISPTPFISKHRIYSAIKRFGSDHIIFGSDTPYGKNNLKNNLIKINNMNLTPKQKELILGENIKRLLHI